jgi:hypothetical protein
VKDSISILINILLVRPIILQQALNIFIQHLETVNYPLMFMIPVNKENGISGEVCATKKIP